MPGMQIDIGFGGLGEAVNRLREMERLTAGIARNTGKGAGPAARAVEATGGLRSALLGGETGAIFDAQVKAIRAQQSVERAQRLLGGGPGLGGRLSQLVSTTRFGGGGALGGAMPLVGRTAAALGGEAAAGPLGLAIAAVSGFAAVLNSATQTVGEFRRAATVSGGTAGDVARAGAMGVGPGELGAVSASLRERLVTDARAMGAAQRIGLTLPGHRLAGDTNEARVLTEALKQLRAIRDPNRQLFEARELGMEQFLDRLRTSEPIWQALIRDSEQLSKTMQSNSQAFRDYEGQLDRLGMAWANVIANLGGQLAPEAGNIAGDVAGGLNWWTRAQERVRDWARDFNKAEPDWLKPLFHFNVPGGDAPQTATEKNTAALEANTQMIAEGMFGGGPRAEGAVPVHLRGQLLGEALRTQKLNLGVFGN